MLSGCTIKVEPIAKKEPVTYHARKHNGNVHRANPSPLPMGTPFPNATSVPDWPHNFRLLKPVNPELDPDAGSQVQRNP